VTNKKKMDARLPMIRVAPDIKERLERIAERSVGGVSDHVRAAIERYVKEEEAALQLRAPQQS
jgi:predicted transcriptional regulator